MANRNAKVIVPFVLVAWLGFLVVLQPATPVVFQAAFIVAIAVAIPVMVFYLMAEMGWRTLAKRFPARQRFRGRWTPTATAQMAHVSVHEPEFERNRIRLVGGMLRLGTTETALHLSMLPSKVPMLGRFFPEVEIPWSAVTKVTTFEAPGWFKPLRQPGTFLQAGYDPNYTGTFVELEVGQPSVFLQLPATLLGESTERLGLPSTAPGPPADVDRGSEMVDPFVGPQG